MKMNRVIALMIGLLLTFSMTACGEQMSAMNTDMEEKTEEKSAMDMDEKMEESSDMNMMEGKTEEQLLAVENDILFANNALWEKVFMSMDKNVNDDMLSSNYGDVLMSAVEGAKDQFSAEEYEALKADAEKIQGDRGADRGACRRQPGRSDERRGTGRRFPAVSGKGSRRQRRG